MPAHVTVRGTTQAEITQWAKGLADLATRIAPRFARAEPRRRGGAYLRGLLSARTAGH